MAKKRNVDPETVNHITENLFTIFPILKKKLIHANAIQREHGIPFSQVQVLSLLHKNGTMSVSEISRILEIAKPNITPLVDKLFQAGLVDRRHDDNDRRIVNIVLMPEGERKLTDIRGSVSAEIIQDCENFSVNPADFKELDEMLDNMQRILSVIQ